MGELYQKLKNMKSTSPYAPPTSSERSSPNNKSCTSSIVAKVLMWITWASSLCFTAMLVWVIHDTNEAQNAWLSSDIVWILTLLILLSPTLLLRFKALRKIKNPWVQLLTFWVGLFCAQMLISTGLFMFESGQHTYLLIGISSIAAYCPYWIRPLSYQ